MAMTKKRVYPDTPIALHYRPFADVDWCALADADEVVVVITAVLIREVDHHKDHGRGTLQQRARRFSSWLGSVRKNKVATLRPNVQVEMSMREPELDVDFKAHGLEASVNDDKVVAFLIRDGMKYPDIPLVCVTSDNALALKVEGAGFAVIDPPDDHRLPHEPDPVEQANRQLQEEIAQLRKRAAPEPKLSLRFESGSDRTVVTLSGLELPGEEEIEEEIDAERADLDLRYAVLNAIKYRPPDAQHIEHYLAQLRRWATKFAVVGVQRAHTADLRLALANDGTGNAADVEVELSMPDGAYVAETRDLPGVADRPMPPEPTERLSALTFARYEELPVPRVPPFELPSPVRVDSDGDPRRTRIIAALCKHRSQLRLPKLQIWFDAGAVPRGVRIHYRIHAASPPLIEGGDLYVKVDAKAGPFRFLRSKLGHGDETEPTDE